MPTALPYRVEGDLTFGGITLESAQAAKELFREVVAALTQTEVTNYTDGRPRSPAVDVYKSVTVRRLRRRLEARGVRVDYLVEVASAAEADAALALVLNADEGAVDALVEAAAPGYLDDAARAAMTTLEVGNVTAVPDPPAERAARSVPDDAESGVQTRGGYGGRSAGLVFVLCLLCLLLSIVIYLMGPGLYAEDPAETKAEADSEDHKLEAALQDAAEEIEADGDAPSTLLHAKLQRTPKQTKTATSIRMRVPPGAKPGTKYEATLSDGRKAVVDIPPTAKAGDALEIPVAAPVEVVPAPPPECIVTPAPPPPDDLEHRELRVPDDAKGGDRLRVAHPAGGAMDVVLPYDVRPGETLVVPVPAKVVPVPAAAPLHRETAVSRAAPAPAPVAAAPVRHHRRKAPAPAAVPAAATSSSPSITERVAALASTSAYPAAKSMPPWPYPETKKAAPAEAKGAAEEKATEPSAGAPESKAAAPVATPKAAKAIPKPKAVSTLKKSVKGSSSPDLQERLRKLEAAGASSRKLKATEKKAPPAKQAVAAPPPPKFPPLSLPPPAPEPPATPTQPSPPPAMPRETPTADLDELDDWDEGPDELDDMDSLEEME